nr:response regulator transcription factor [Bacteroidota bacterium]
MSKIKVILIDEHPIVRSGIVSLLDSTEDIEVIEAVKGVDTFFEKMRHMPATYGQVVIFDVYNPNDLEIENIRKIKKAYGKISILVLAMYSNETFILKCIKAGAKGFLSNQTTRNEIVEAIYTLRSGYEYLGKSITNIILNSYLSHSKIGDNGQAEMAQLSLREMEVLKLFGEGHTNQEIADKLFISIRTVETHKNNIMKKINLRTTVDLVKFAIRNNIIDI